MEQLIIHIPKVYDKRYLLLEDYTSIDHIGMKDGNGGETFAAETFMSPEPDCEAIVVNYRSDEVTLFNVQDSKFLRQLQKRNIPFEPVENQFVMRPNKKNHQS